MDISTKKLDNSASKDERPSSSVWDLNRLLDIFWGGSERRITLLTLRIMAVNVVALIVLAIGVFFLGQYHNNLVEARLNTFQREVELVSIILMESEFRDQNGVYKEEQVRGILKQVNLDPAKQLYVFDSSHELLVNTRNAVEDDLIFRNRLQSVEVLKSLLQFALSWLPDRKELPSYPENLTEYAASYPGVMDSFEGEVILNAWRGRYSRVFLTASVPLVWDGEVEAVLLMTWEGQNIDQDLNEVWSSMLSVFGVTCILTIILSIYLSGAISRPLKKLAKAAENLRKGQGRAEDIPDFSMRMDEIGDLSVVLRDMTMTLSEKMDAIERFAADVSHELKNPLTSLRSAVETLSVVKAEEDKEKLMGIIEHDINRLDRLITDISRSSRLDTEIARQSFKTLDLRVTLKNVLLMFDMLLNQKDVSKVDGWAYRTESQGVQIALESDLNGTVFIEGVEGHLMQVFENIISNALSFAPKGSTILISVEKRKNKVFISIENMGPPIPKGKEETIFERFYSERPEHEEYGQNSGLGLSICKQIIDAHMGDIYAENIIGFTGEAIGVRFNIVLDVVNP